MSNRVATKAQLLQNARITLKLFYFLHDKVTLPTSLVVTDPFLRTLVLENTDFLIAGSLLLDLRISCNDLREPVASKYGSAELEWGSGRDNKPK